MVRSPSLMLAVAIVIAAAIIAAALYLRPEANRYRFETNSTEVRRFDTATGEVRVCSKEGGCWTFPWE